MVVYLFKRLHQERCMAIEHLVECLNKSVSNFGSRATTRRKLLIIMRFSLQ